MTKVVASRDRGNSPRKRFVQTSAVSIENGDDAVFLRCVVDDVVWACPGRPIVVGFASAKGDRVATVTTFRSEDAR